MFYIRGELQFILLSIILFTFYLGNESNKVEDNLDPEQAKSEKLLNILPGDVADELNRCFSYFDAVTRRNNREKIKTIGDSYMLADGLPEESLTHPIDCLLAAMEIQEFIDQLRIEKEARGEHCRDIRGGLNTGPLVAGVIGEMKFACEVFGDTVNTASRMESSGIPGKINISETTYERFRLLFDCECRGKIVAKRKVEMTMYFVNGIKPEFSVDGAGKKPNEKFKDIYQKVHRGAKVYDRDAAHPEMQPESFA